MQNHVCFLLAEWHDAFLGKQAFKSSVASRLTSQKSAETEGEVLSGVSASRFINLEHCRVVRQIRGLTSSPQKQSFTWPTLICTEALSLA